MVSIRGGISIALLVFFFQFNSIGQDCTNPVQLCSSFGNVSGSNENGVIGSNSFCYTSENSVFFYFETNEFGGSVSININNLNCVADTLYDDELQAALFSATNLCNPNTFFELDCVNGDSLQIDLFGATLNPNSIYYIEVDGDFNDPASINPAQCTFNINISGSAVDNPLDAGPDVSISAGESTILEVTGINTVSWMPPDGLESPDSLVTVASPTVTTTYSVSTIVHGCPFEDDVTVFVVPPIITSNTFTPNGDGYNDFWEIKRINRFPTCSVKIFSRWGQVVFKSIGYVTPWDGMQNGSPLPSATYYYVIELNSAEVSSDPIMGSVTIIY